MTDQQQVEAMWDRVGIAWHLAPITADEPQPAGAAVRLQLSADAAWPLRGHSGFYLDYWFSPSGDLLGIGVWE